MTPEERFERIERDLMAASEAIKVMAESLVEARGALAAMIVSGNRMHDAFSDLTATVQHYVEASDERMKQMEANLDALIRIITAEHSNGRGKL